MDLLTLQLNLVDIVSVRANSATDDKTRKENNKHLDDYIFYRSNNSFQILRKLCLDFDFVYFVAKIYYTSFVLL